MVSLIIDDTTLLLLLLLLLTLLLTIYTSRTLQPLLHPLILTRQADVSRVRHHGESAIFRNANSPPGFELAARPRRGADSVGKMLKLGSATSAVTGTFKAGFGTAGADSKAHTGGNQTILGQQTSTEEMLKLAARFANGLQRKLASSGKCALVVHADEPSFAAGVVLLSAAQGNHELFVIPTNAQKPAALPATSQASANAVFTTANALAEGSALTFLQPDALVILPDQAQLDEAKKRSDSTAYQLATFQQVCEAAEGDSETSIEDTLQTIYAHYWTGRSWVPVSNGNLTAGVTAPLGAFSADKIPTRADTILCSDSSDQHSSLCSTPAGFALLLLAAYTGASLHMTSDQGILAAISSSKATMLYISPLGAAELATALTALSAKSAPLSIFAARSKLYALRQGALARDSWWDHLHFSRVRKKAGIEQLRSVTVVDTAGTQMGQNVVDVLRAYTGSPVTHAYLPIGSRSVQSDSQEALFTAPIATSHAGDLQAFDVGPDVAYHVGPPSVSVEIKLQETAAAKQMGYTIESVKGPEVARVQTRWPADPAGEVYVRGKTVATASEADAWISTSDIASFRTNGTLVVVKSKDQDAGVIEVEHLGSRMSSSKPRAGRGTAHRTAALSVLLLGCIGSVSAAGGDPNVTMVAAARSGMMAAQRPSWVQGTSASALLELEGAPAWNYFAGTNNGPVYRAGNLNPGASGLPIDVLNMGYHAVAAQDGAGRLCSRITGEERLNAGSSLDSSNCAMPVLLAAVSVGQLSDNNADGSGYYADAAAAQLAFVTQRTNRTRDGAISQRNDDLQIWSDSMMMISSLGVYGLMYDNQTLLQLAYDQLRLYREALLQPNGMVAHIYDVSNNSFSDGSSWATGNGWATAGMLRVIACIAQSSHASAMLQQQADLFGWTASILDAAYTYADANTGLVRNHINETESFLDAAGSMLIAYSTFRLASMAANSDQHVDAAEKIYSTVQGRLDPFGHFFDIQTADALTFSEPGPTSPEALAFALLLAAARRDYAAKNVTGIYGPGTNNRAPPSVVNGQLMQGAVVPGANSAASVPLPALLTVSALALLATILIS